MNFELAALEFVILDEPFTPKPFIKGWNRLEGRVRLEKFERALRAEARDPLWFLTRQWQFLEFKADDAGSPIEARMAMRQRKLDLYSAREGPARPFPRDVPLEAIVERETPPLDRIAFIQINRAARKVLQRDVPNVGDRDAALSALRAAFPIGPTPKIDGVDDEEAKQLALLTDPHLFDAGKLLAAANPASSLASAPGLSPPQRSAATAAAIAARDWYAALYLAPPNKDETAWAPAQLEYKFSCATAAARDQLVLIGDGYAQGKLDWFAVDVDRPRSHLGTSRDTPEPSPVLDEALSFIPTAIDFAGMPSHRFWEMEDRKVEFGHITASTTDIAKLLLTEFMLAYANDWCLIPFEADVGALCEAQELVVHDVFGDATLVRAADRGTDEDWRRWAMFGLETRQEGDVAEPRLFLPPATPKTMESPPIDRVVFLRDEMANLCWAAERTVASAAGMGIDGERYAISLAPAATPDPPPDPGAAVRYRLGTGAPLNWRPFIPVHKPGTFRSIRLQRARLPMGSADPLGAILVGEGLAPTPYYVNEEEVPRAGRIVTRSFQRTRWLDGRVVVWLGRRTMTGRGPGSSGLVFDTLEDFPTET